MFPNFTARNVVKTAVTIAANKMMCDVVEETLDTFTDSDTHYVSLGVGTAIYFGRYHHSLMNGVDKAADWLVARCERETAETSAA